MKNLCPLCGSKQTVFYSHSGGRDFYSCHNCNLIFVSKNNLLPIEEEKKRYDHHQNHIIDQGYKDFLYQVILPIKERLSKKTKGLDFGSGPFPALVQLLEKEGYIMENYDFFYHKDKSIFTKTYDFITLTEVAEHFYNPSKEFERLYQMLEQGGYLFIMTHRTDLVTDFDKWYYKNDETHVCFYADRSMDFLAKKYQMKRHFLSNRLVCFQK